MWHPLGLSTGKAATRVGVAGNMRHSDTGGQSDPERVYMCMHVHFVEPQSWVYRLTNLFSARHTATDGADVNLGEHTPLSSFFMTAAAGPIAPLLRWRFLSPLLPPAPLGVFLVPRFLGLGLLRTYDSRCLLRPIGTLLRPIGTLQIFRTFQIFGAFRTFYSLVVLVRGKMAVAA